VFGREVVFWRPKIIISSAQKTIAGTKIIMSGSNHIASLPDLIVLGSEDNHVRAGNDRLEAGNKYFHDDQDCLSLGLDRYDGFDNYLRPQEDRYENGDGY